jgi:hypothetical protein
MSQKTTKTDICKGCGEMVEAPLWRKFTNSGSETFVRICPVCTKFAPFGGALWIAKDEVYRFFTKTQIEAMPVIMPECSSRCVVCGNRTAELHHWSPKAIFNDEAESWPKDYLCKPCHDKWHRMVTPNITWS